jgi:chemotaxis signal transduction protein
VTDEVLNDFIDAEASDRSVEVRESRVTRELLVFEFGQDRFAVDAACVEGVVPWKAPSRIPGADARVRGVIQDRGRIVVLMAHPAGLQRPTSTDGKRIVICSTPRGHIGLPATATNSVGAVELLAIPTPLSIHDSKLGAFTYLDPIGYSVGH